MVVATKISIMCQDVFVKGLDGQGRGCDYFAQNVAYQKEGISKGVE